MNFEVEFVFTKFELPKIWIFRKLRAELSQIIWNGRSAEISYGKNRAKKINSSDPTKIESLDQFFTTEFIYGLGYWILIWFQSKSWFNLYFKKYFSSLQIHHFKVVQVRIFSFIRFDSLEIFSPENNCFGPRSSLFRS